MKIVSHVPVSVWQHPAWDSALLLWHFGNLDEDRCKAKQYVGDDDDSGLLEFCGIRRDIDLGDLPEFEG